jgi:hypothetical protein
MDNLPAEVFDIVLEHIQSLDDLGALSLVNRQAARQCLDIRPKVLWRIAYRTCRGYCNRHGEEKGAWCPCDCSVVVPALEEPESVPFKVRAWLYRRASARSFGISEEALERCIIPVEEDMKNPYAFDILDPENARRKLGVPHGDYCEEDDVEEREWNLIWLTFKRHLVMQRVQRVNVGDWMVRPEWKRLWRLERERLWRLEEDRLKSLVDYCFSMVESKRARKQGLLK